MMLSSSPAALLTSLAELPAQARLRWLARRSASFGLNVRVLGRVYLHGTGQLHVGDDVELDGRAAAIELHCQEDGVIVLGRGVRIAGGVSIEALLRIEIGDETRIGGFAKILDNNFHPLSGDRHETRPPSLPVTVGKNCSIGWRAILLPGAQVGDRTELCPGVVVSRRIPADARIAGSPPRLVRPGSAE